MALQNTQNDMSPQTSLASKMASFHTKFKSSLALHDDMPDMLSRAPLALNLLGQCRLLAFGENIGSIETSPPAGEWKHLRQHNLSSNLVQLGHLGQDAFDIADRNMRKLQLCAQQSFGADGTAGIRTVIMCLSDPKLAKLSLSREMEALRGELRECVELVRVIEETFNIWGEAARELEESATMTRDQKMKQTEEAKNEADINRIKLEAQKENLARTSRRLEKLEKERDEAMRIYKDASNRNHSQWKGLGFMVVSELSNSTLSAVNGAIDIAKAVPNVVSDISRAVGNFGTFGSAPMDTPVRAESGNQRADPAAFPDANDPAYEKANEINGLTSTLWDIITRSLDQGLQESTRDELHKSLLAIQNCRLSLENENRSSGPSQRASSILNDSEKIVRAILDNQSKASSLNDDEWKHLRAKWNTDIGNAADQAARLKTQACSQPGRAYGENIPQLKTHGPIDSRGLLAQSQNDLRIKQQAMLGMQAGYEESAKRFELNQASIVKIATDLRQLENKQTTIKQIREILASTIFSIGQMQMEIRRLVSYFDVIHNVIEHICRSQCEKFVNTIKDSVDQGSYEERAIATSFTEVQAQDLFAKLLTLRGHFAVINDSAQFYSQISRDHIIPALHDVGELPINSTSQHLRRQADLLQERTIYSAKAIQAIGAKRMNESMQKLHREIQEIEADLEQSGLSEGQDRRQAIEQGAKDVQNVAIQGIQTRPIAQAPELSDL